MDCFVTLVLFRRFQSQADLGKAVSLPLLALDSSLMSDATLFSASQYQTICASLPDPVFILTLSGRYAAVLGGKPSGAVGHCIIESPELAGAVDAYVSIMRMRRLGEQILVWLRFESISDEQLQIIRDFEARGRPGRGAHPG